MKAIVILVLLFFFSPFASAWSFLSDTQVSSGTQFKETRIGGLSALYLYEGKYYALSDDRGKFNEPRIYQYDIKSLKAQPAKNKVGKAELTPEIAILPERVIFLKDTEGKPLIKMSIDPEGLVVFKDGSFLVSSEGNVNAKPRLGPQLFHFTKDGIMIRELPLPEYFQPEKIGEAKTGIRNNLGPEGLSISPSGKYLFMAFENVLVQDGEDTSYEKEGLLRVLKYKIENDNSLILESEKLYPMSNVTHPKSKAVLLGTGVSEVKALNDNKLLFLERSASQLETTVQNEIKLFLADFSTGDEVKGTPSLLGKSVKPMKKNLALDLDSVVNQFRGVKMLDNMEAMEFGPDYKGKKTLLILSDDNFLAVQRSLWIWMQLPEKL